MIIKILRKLIRIFLKPFIREELFDYSTHKSLVSQNFRFINELETQRYISNALIQNRPIMVSRFGYTELNTLFRFENYLKMNEIEKIFQWTENYQYPFSKNCRLNNIEYLSGFFPVNKESLLSFKEEMITSMQEINLLGSWVEGENKYIDNMPNIKVCKLESLEPYFSKDPWSLALEGKKVLVIHPFSETIQKQFKKNRKFIFENKKILPNFDLKILKAPITYPGGESRSKSWFEMLEKLNSDALKLDFEVAIIGCGAYGMPLAARLKKAGKKTIHLGGATQILFGIKGKRWDENQKFQKMYNESWVHPSSENKVFKNVEDGCYW